MRLESLFHPLLGLGESWEMVSLSVSEDRSTVEIEVCGTAALWVGLKCPDDGEALARHGHGERRRWRHLNIFEYRCEIACALPRGHRGRCGKTLTVEPPWRARRRDSR